MKMGSEMLTREFTVDELALLLEVLNNWRESIEHLNDTAHEQELEALEAKLRGEK